MDEGKEKERRMEEVQEQMTAKRILYRKKDSSWFGSDYNVNLYQGCPHGCIYCDIRSECYGVEHFSQVRAKRDALDLLQKQLASCRKGGMVATGSMSDPYNPLEEKQRLTRGMLTLLLRYSFGVSIATKSSLVERDIDLLEQIKGYAPALVKLTITTPHDRLAEQLEPHAPSSSRRLQTLERLRARGIFAGVLLMPVLPFLEDNPKDIRLLVERCAQAGAKFIYPYFGVTLRDRQREYFLECLEKSRPDVRKKYLVLGEQYDNRCPNEKELWQVFCEECKKYGILWRMEQIITASKEPYQNEQLCLFR